VNYSEVIALLMSNKSARKRSRRSMKRYTQKNKLPGLDRELDFSEIAIMTRAGTAKVLGLLDTKGHLGVGADADVSIYDIKPDQIDHQLSMQR